jgi:hypothetical protein
MAKKAVKKAPKKERKADDNIDIPNIDDNDLVIINLKGVEYEVGGYNAKVLIKKGAKFVKIQKG